MMTNNDQAKAGDHPAVKQLLTFFNYEHLPMKLKETSQQFSILARWMADNLPPNAEATVAMRKLLEAKDAAVRATL